MMSLLRGLSIRLQLYVCVETRIAVAMQALSRILLCFLGFIILSK